MKRHGGVVLGGARGGAPPRLAVASSRGDGGGGGSGGVRGGGGDGHRGAEPSGDRSRADAWRVCAGVEGAWSGARAGGARRKGGGGEGLGRGRGRAEPLEGPLPPLFPGRASPLPRFLRHAPSHPSPPPPDQRPQPTVCSPAASQPAHGSSASADTAAPPTSSILFGCRRPFCVQRSPRGPSRQPIARGCSIFPLALPLPAVYVLSLPTSLASDPAGDPGVHRSDPACAESPPGLELRSPSGGLCCQGSARLYPAPFYPLLS
ncbi:hypothetical protein P7K49_021791 [Saguinus oedipus]|uniref:Uncharacterized protein n=1 Tax=Saguinus oedipus TaxID=9490 RepID=A0ABQ9UTL9_SAGOE|nr:hypothetical protein P7K49_021791 [Saguinus oedipus]